jgi:hypothetical protein
MLKKALNSPIPLITFIGHFALYWKQKMPSFKLCLEVCKSLPRKFIGNEALVLPHTCLNFMRELSRHTLGSVLLVFKKCLALARIHYQKIALMNHHELHNISHRKIRKSVLVLISQHPWKITQYFSTLNASFGNNEIAN